MYAVGYTGCFWDYRDLPIPETPHGINPSLIHLKVLDALESKLLLGHLAIWFFAEKPIIQDNFEEAQLFFPEGGEFLLLLFVLLMFVYVWNVS